MAKHWIITVWMSKLQYPLEKQQSELHNHCSQTKFATFEASISQTSINFDGNQEQYSAFNQFYFQTAAQHAERIRRSYTFPDRRGNFNDERRHATNGVNSSRPAQPIDWISGVYYISLINKCQRKNCKFSNSYFLKILFIQMSLFLNNISTNYNRAVFYLLI